MLDRIIRFSLENKVLVWLGTLALVCWGIYQFSRLPIDAIPDITNNQSQVLTVCPTLATQEVEQFVTAPIEQSVRNIPGVVELRSISRFGLSVVTVVFRDDVDQYLARQLLNERLKEAESIIPEGLGTPELAPISTGLGEILHYRIEPKPGYEQRYSATELRTIQEWIVKKQLAGIPGVVEINSFGGFLKQYEVAVTPERLQSFGLSIGEVYEALQSANENTGGAYIEKSANAYFIRSEGLAHSLDDLRQIVVRNNAGAPLRIGDVADVRLGSALRYGAVSHNGEGEIVLGIVMMLKGENAAHVIRNVKERLATVEKSLPDGIHITTFLDREKLVDRTVSTVRTNLIEGALIVVFILVLLVGNWRAGLVIASVVPLSMLFAIGMMQTFGITANLMSLGAIDFGLIVDGAVIVVEATLHYLHTHYRRLSGGASQVHLMQTEMDESVYHSSSKIMRSSVFGVVIILIVYLPILALTGVEGRMFKPMAQTVSFALIGALLLTLTYVPVASSVFLSKKIHFGQTLADRIIGFCQKIYLPTLQWAFHWKKSVTAAALVLLAGALLLFSRLGGEFIPTLDEGDIMMHGFLKPGSSLTQTLESHRLVQKIILENFPDEVEQVISKIGSAEIPTDPMAIETADNAILLKDKKEWTRAETKEELVALIEEKVQDVPGMAFEFTQPIKMRFDEMMTGVRSDIAVKIFGENLDSLVRCGDQTVRLLREVPGIADLKAEPIQGLPQISVRYDYGALARFGLHIKDVNTALRTAFAGEKAGVMFEDERRFDLVLRLDTTRRRDLEDVRNLPIATPDGRLIPLSAVADVGYRNGAAQISRDNGQRRLVVSANVRGRDVESVIRDVQQIVDTRLDLPAGYHTSLGGQFENLQGAKARLSIAVPVALLLIFTLLFFTFNSIKESALIFTAIPFSAIGGVLALWLRDMPFSISAGVGFIALFGVAVLNGIVLISYFNQLEKEGVTDVYERIRQGALVRLRPVLMTAAVASLGFLPMALSHGAGAEVQRPLATVVIGGLVTSTLLTLLVLPVLYALFFAKRKIARSRLTVLLPLLMALGAASLNAQTALTEQEAIQLALANHPTLKAGQVRIEQQQLLARAPAVWAPADVYHNITADPDLGMFGATNFGVNQNFPAPRYTRAQRGLHERQAMLATAEQHLSQQELIREVRGLYRHLAYLNSKKALFVRLDSLYQIAAATADSRYRAGEIGLAEQMAARDQSRRIRLELETIGHETGFDQYVLGKLLGLSTPVEAIVPPFQPTDFNLADTVRLRGSAGLMAMQQRIEVAQAEQKTEQARRSPNFNAGLSAQYLANDLLYPGYQIGLSVPLVQKGWNKRLEASAKNIDIAREAYNNALLQREMELGHLLHELEKYGILREYYLKESSLVAAELLRSAQRNYQAGEFDFIEFSQYADRALRIELDNLENQYNLNRTVVEIQALLGE